MSKLENAVRDIHIADQGKVNNAGIHPAARLLVTLGFILITISFSGNQLAGICSMAVYPVIQIVWNRISVKEILRHIWPVLLLILIMSAANPFLDRSYYGQIGSLVITGGMVSMLALILKGVFSVAAVWILASHTGMEGICYGLRFLHVPKEIVTIILLIHRYLIVLLREVERMTLAYRLRAPGQKGLHPKSWGSFVGQLLLRSLDRAQQVYDSMQLRGYNGEFPSRAFTGKRSRSLIYAGVWLGVFAVLRRVPVFPLLGALLIRLLPH
jgi:cobalt/nickel transport system permease protein